MMRPTCRCALLIILCFIIITETLCVAPLQDMPFEQATVARFHIEQGAGPEVILQAVNAGENVIARDTMRKLWRLDTDSWVLLTIRDAQIIQV